MYVELSGRLRCVALTSVQRSVSLQERGKSLLVHVVGITYYID